MAELTAAILAEARQNSAWELAAAVLAVLYLLLAVRENVWCWAAALVSTAIYLVVFWSVGLLMESALQVFYIVMAVYGWWHWTRGGTGGAGLPVTTRRASYHVLIVTVVLGFSAVSGTLLATYTDAERPFLDSFTTWGAIVTTWLVAQKVFENWIYWIVIDAVSIYLYVDRELWFTVLLFCSYLAIIPFGMWSWYRSLAARLAAT